MKYFLPKRRVSGQTLISLLIALGIFGILAHAIFTLTTSSFKIVSFSRARIAGRHIAEEKIETIRNMPYDTIGTAGGIPSGILPQVENRFLNGLNYVIKISVVYKDDPFDGLAPNDLLPTDYKSVRVEVSWQGAGAGATNNPVVITTDISPKGIETATGGGTLSILVFDANATPVSQATVNIFSDDVVPNINITQNTNDNGRMIIPGIPQCLECYDITITKPGYSSDRTYSVSEVANPTKPPASIVEGALTEISFAIDRSSTLIVSTFSRLEGEFIPLPDTPFVITGTKTIGTDIYDYPVYKLNSQFTTGASGTLTITDIEWDNYTLSLPLGSPYDFATTNPLNPYAVLPNMSVNWLLWLHDDTANNLRLIFIDSITNLVASVSARLTGPGGFDETKITGNPQTPDFGQVFFPDLSSGTYSLTATSEAFLEVNKSVSVSGNTQDITVLDPITP